MCNFCEDQKSISDLGGYLSDHKIRYCPVCGGDILLRMFINDMEESCRKAYADAVIATLPPDAYIDDQGYELVDGRDKYSCKNNIFKPEAPKRNVGLDMSFDTTLDLNIDKELSMLGLPREDEF